MESRRGAWLPETHSMGFPSGRQGSPRTPLTCPVWVAHLQTVIALRRGEGNGLALLREFLET